jgi:hypothetical protein
MDQLLTIQPQIVAVDKWKGCSVDQPPTVCVIGKIEGGVKVVDQAAPPVIHVMLAGQRPEDEHNVIVPNDWDSFRTGRTLTPEGNLCVLWSFDHQRVEERMNRNRPSRQQRLTGQEERSLAVLVPFEMKTTLRSHDLCRSGIARSDAARR